MFNKVTADDNRAYFNSRSNRKQYVIESDRGRVTTIKTIHVTPDGKFYYNSRNGKLYDTVYVNKNNVYTLERYYRQNKSIPGLKRLIVKVKHHADDSYCPYIGVIYSLENTQDEDFEILPHGNAKSKNARSHIRTSLKTMERERGLLEEGQSVQYVYDKIIEESGGIFKSQSQSLEPRDKRQIYSQKAKRKRQNYDNNQANVDDNLSNLLRRLKMINVVESIVIKSIAISTLSQRNVKLTILQNFAATTMKYRYLELIRRTICAICGSQILVTETRGL